MSNKHKKTFLPPKALNIKQAELIKAINSKELVVTTGPAGTGKTYVAAAYAAYFYHHSKCDKIILTRPTVPVGKSLGFFPGTLEEKLQPWVYPFISVLEDFLSKGEVECMVKNDKIQLVPFETIRGHTFNNAFVVLDEGQNTTTEEMKAFVTRLGKNTTTVVNGDISQSDIKGSRNGLKTICDIIMDEENSKLQEKCALIEFDYFDIVRSDLCKLFVQAFDKQGL